MRRSRFCDVSCSTVSSTVAFSASHCGRSSKKPAIQQRRPFLSRHGLIGKAKTESGAHLGALLFLLPVFGAQFAELSLRLFVARLPAVRLDFQLLGLKPFVLARKEREREREREHNGRSAKRFPLGSGGDAQSSPQFVGGGGDGFLRLALQAFQFGVDHAEAGVAVADVAVDPVRVQRQVTHFGIEPFHRQLQAAFAFR